MSEVNRCVCTGLTFAELSRHPAAGSGFEALRRATGCGEGCGLCEPYVRAMLRTGRPSFRALAPCLSGGESGPAGGGAR
ncbi:MAG: (2Fe-2S)-binding protein [Phycisphaerales bacterium]|nr:(2Fe-2S)-binding protein [Phycisphaerales bacterium]